MTKHALELKIRNIEGALIRALGTTERRGFRVLGVELDDAAEHADEARQLRLVVRSDRCVNTLSRQLEKLHDVFAVAITTEPAVVPVAMPVQRAG